MTEIVPGSFFLYCHVALSIDLELISNCTPLSSILILVLSNLEWKGAYAEHLAFLRSILQLSLVHDDSLAFLPRPIPRIAVRSGLRPGKKNNRDASPHRDVTPSEG